MRRFVAMLTTAVILAVGASAQVDRPTHARRIVRVFTFEEREIHDAPVPIHWFRAQHNPPTRTRPAYPIWNRATLEYEGAYDGEGCVRLPSRGGSTALRLESGVVPVLPGAEYSVRAMVRGVSLESALVAISARFLDASGEALVTGERTRREQLPDESWREMELDLGVTPDDAAFLQIDLELVQPSENGPEGFYRDDLAASAWFDDVAIVMRPRLSLNTTEGGPLWRGDESPRVALGVRDLAGESLTARLRAYDIQGRVVDERIEQVDPSGRVLNWEPTLPIFGWYRIEATLIEGGRAIVRRTADIARLPAQEPRRARAGIGIIARDAGSINELPALAERAGLDRAVIPAWDAATLSEGDAKDRVPERVEALARVVSALRERGVLVAISIDRVPVEAAREALLDPGDASAWIVGGHGSLQTYLDPLLQRLGQSVDTWAIGTGKESAAQSLGDVARALSRLVAGVRVVVRSRVESPDLPDSSSRDAGAEIVRLLPIDSSLRDEALQYLGDHLAQARAEGTPSDDTWLAIQPSAEATYGALESSASIVRRLALARANLPDAELLLDEVIPPAMISPALSALAHAGDRLAGMRAVALFSPAPRSHAVLFRASRIDDPGVIVAWSDDAHEPGELLMMLSLGSVRVVDMFGNARDVEAEAVGDRGLRTHRIALSREPVFIEGVDTPLVRFQTAFSIEPARLASDDSTHEHALRLTNPWTSPIRARYYLVKPGEPRDDGTRDRSWTISPRAGEVALGAGVSAERPLSIAMTPYQPEGEIDAVLDVELEAGRTYGLVRLRAPLRVGIDDLRAAVHVENAGNDAVVVVTLANLSDRPRDLEIVVFAEAGGVRQRTVVSALDAEQIAVRRLAFDAHALGSRLFVSIMDAATGERLNRIVDLIPTTIARAEDDDG